MSKSSILIAALAAFLLFPHITSGQGTWQIINPLPEVSPILDAAIVSAGTAIAVGSYGTIHITRDTGTSWTYPRSGVATTLRSIAFSNSLVGLIVGDGGVILRTSDGGETWSRQSSPNEDKLGDVAFTPDGNAVAIGEAGRIIHSSDGGFTWDVVSASTTALKAISITSSGIFVVSGLNGTVLKSTNGGVGWISVGAGSNPTLDYITSPSELVWYGAENDGKTYKTTNGGESWTELQTGLFRIRSLQFLDENYGLILASEIDHIQAPTTLKYTDDGGASWKYLPGSIFQALTGFTFMNKNIGVGFGNNGTLQHYSRQSSAAGFSSKPQSISQKSFFYTALDCSDDRNCTAVGYYFRDRRYENIIFRTTDGGDTWSEQDHDLATAPSPDRFSKIHSVDCIDSLHIIMAGDRGIILRTTDAGQTWVHADYPILWPGIPDGPPRSFETVSFSDRLHGVIGSHYNYVIRTTDGGQSWIGDSIHPLSTGPVYQWTNDRILALGAPNRLFTLTNNTWSTDSIPVLRGRYEDIGMVFSIAAASDRIAWIAGRRSTPQSTGDLLNSILVKSTDGGKTWETIIDQERLDIPFGLSKVSFADQLNGLAAGSGNTILHTRNGGVSWEPDTIGKDIVPLFSTAGLAFPSKKTAFIAGREFMFRYREEQAGGIGSDAGKIADNQMSIKAIQPNPSRGYATIDISWSGALQASNLTLKVYDVLGEEVMDATPDLRGNAVENNARIHLDCSGLARGTYYITLKSNSGTTSRPLLLIR